MFWTWLVPGAGAKKQESISRFSTTNKESSGKRLPLHPFSYFNLFLMGFSN